MSVKSALVDLSLSQDSFEMSLEGIVLIIAKDEITDHAFLGGWTAAESMSLSAVTRLKNIPK